ncbi:MAG: hypothetical protein ACI4HI_02720 [Lachnospiraceae bacterium]
MRRRTLQPEYRESEKTRNKTCKKIGSKCLAIVLACSTAFAVFGTSVSAENLDFKVNATQME